MITPKQWPECNLNDGRLCRVEEQNALASAGSAGNYSLPALIDRAGNIHRQTPPRPKRNWRCVVCGKSWSEEA